MPDSAVLLARLNTAESQANTIIEDAKKYRKALLNKARAAAAEELQAFSESQERQYQASIGSTKDEDTTKELETKTSDELAMVETDFNRNKDKTVGYVVEKVLDVPLALTSTQRQALIAEASRPAPAAPAKAAPKPVKAAPAPVFSAPPPVQAAPAPTPAPTPAPAPAPAPKEPEPAPAPKEEPTPAPVEEEPAPAPKAEEPEEAPAPAAENKEDPAAKRKSRKNKNKSDQ